MHLFGSRGSRPIQVPLVHHLNLRAAMTRRGNRGDPGRAPDRRDERGRRSTGRGPSILLAATVRRAAAAAAAARWDCPSSSEMWRTRAFLMFASVGLLSLCALRKRNYWSLLFQCRWLFLCSNLVWWISTATLPNFLYYWWAELLGVWWWQMQDILSHSWISLALEKVWISNQYSYASLFYFYMCNLNHY